MDQDLRMALRETLNAVERLLNLFRVERIVHLVIGILAFGMMLYATVLLYRKDLNTQLLICVFGSSGLITVSSARITYFFNKAFKLVEQVIHGIIKSGAPDEQH